jgi:hypothetical protein
MAFFHKLVNQAHGTSYSNSTGKHCWKKQFALAATARICHMMLGRVNAPINPQFLLETKFLLRKDGLRVRILQGEKTTQLEKVH